MTVSQILKAFPNIQWTGESNIHRSVARSIFIDLSECDSKEAGHYLANAEPKKVMQMLILSDYGKTAADYIAQLPLGNCAWLLNPKEFETLAYYLTYRSLQNQKPTLRGNRIINPATQNVFIPILLLDGVVGAIRFWANPSGLSIDNSFGFGFRIRFEVMEDVENERDKTRAFLEEMMQVTQSLDVTENVTEFADIKEPLSDVESEVLSRVRVHVGYL